MQKTKKNWALRILSLVLMFTLVSTCLLSGTLAKYVTTGSGADTARVAKWGVVIAATDGLFQREFRTTEDPYTSVIYNSVQSSNADNVVAPGTSGVAASFSITGTPEVGTVTKVTVDRAACEFENWKDAAGNDYEPIVWTLTDHMGNAQSDLTFADLLDALDAIEVVYAPNEDLAAHIGDKYAISWDWAFHIDDDNDIKDTFLGNQAAAGNAATIKLAYDIAVTQID